jgi:hypothetical protein
MASKLALHQQPWQEHEQSFTHRWHGNMLLHALQQLKKTPVLDQLLSRAAGAMYVR